MAAERRIAETNNRLIRHSFNEAAAKWPRKAGSGVGNARAGSGLQ
jgi:hypothetical protein